MKKLLLSITLIVIGTILYAQLPNVPYANYDTKDGEVIDLRDGGTYVYKKYGSYYWFMQNLNWDGYDGVNENTRGTAGYVTSIDPDGSKFGRFYKTNTLNNVCPTGWTSANLVNFRQLIKDINSEYDGVSLNMDGYGWTVLDGLKYLRAGGFKSEHADGLWEDNTGTYDARANEIQFNLLPAGGFDGTNYIKDEEVGKKAYVMLEGNDRFQTNTYTSIDTRYTFDALRHVQKADSYGMVRCFKLAASGTPITTPYPTTFEIKQIVSSDVERIRIGHTMRKFDNVLTGFYINDGKKLEINVEELQASTDGQKIYVNIGTPALINKDDPTKEGTISEIELKPGLNIIEGSQHKSGMVYFRYVSHNQKNPQGKMKVSFTSNSEQVRVAHYKYGTTTDEEFVSMLSEYTAPYAMYSSDNLAVVTSYNASLAYIDVDKDVWISDLEKLMELEDELSGLDNSDPNPLHYRLKSGEVRYLFVQAATTAPPHAGDQRTAYPTPGNLLSHILTPTREGVESWMLGHEVGHHHQQGGFLIDGSGESTNNLFSIKVRTYFDNGGVPYVRTPQTKLDNNISKYLELPDDKRIYNMDYEELEKITGINRDEVRMVPWEQLLYIFGEEFYKTLHRITREEQRMDGTDDERKTFLISNTSLISGYDMRDFFNAWGIRVEEKYYQDSIDRTIKNASLEKPTRFAELSKVSGEKFYSGDYAGWLPLSLKGITSSSPHLDPQPADRLASKNKYCDYSTKTGTIIDERDGKEYPYKRYGSYDWFMVNLNWDGYDGKNASTKGSVGYYGLNDANGEVYGRMYPTNPSYNGGDISKYCPAGWTVAGTGDFDVLHENIKASYGLDESKLIECTKCGGDRDAVSDGLWAKGAGNLNAVKAAEVGLNLLPAGVFNKNFNGYDSDDEEGKKASFMNSGWYHSIYTAGSNKKQVINRMDWHNGSARCIRRAAIKEQQITFPTLPNAKLNSTDFNPGATSNSGLTIAYTSSDINVATIVNGKIHVVGLGNTNITASQAGNDTTHAAGSKVQKLTVIPADIVVDSITLKINGTDGYKLTDVYFTECGKDVVEVFVNAPEGTIIKPANPLTINLNKGENKIPITIESSVEAVNTNITVTKPMDFEDLVQTKWNNTYIVINNPKYNGGYKFKSYAWYKNNTLIHEGQYYNAGSSEKATYRIELTTTDGKKLGTCSVELTPNTSKLKVYPTLVSSGESIVIDASEMSDEFLSKSSFEVYTLSGNIVVENKKIKDKVTKLNLSNREGMYLIKVISGTYQETFKVLTK